MTPRERPRQDRRPLCSLRRVDYMYILTVRLRGCQFTRIISSTCRHFAPGARCRSSDTSTLRLGTAKTRGLDTSRETAASLEIAMLFWRIDYIYMYLSS